MTCRCGSCGTEFELYLPPERAFEDTREALDANVDRLNDVVFGPQDYAVVART